MHLSHVIRKCTGNMPGPRSAMQTLCELAPSKCTWTFEKSHFVLKFTGAEIYRKNARAQNRDTDFVRLRSRNALGHCTSMHKFYLQGHLQKNRAHNCVACSVEFHLNIDVWKMYSKNARAQTRGPAQSKCRWTLHKSHFTLKFKGKRPQTKSKQNSRRKLCASLRSRNALGDFTTATLCGNLQGKCRGLE